MKDPVVADSTCLIALERIGLLEILPALFDPVLIPPEVNREFRRFPPAAQGRDAENAALANSLELLVDNGEAEAIALASQQGIRVILDDRQARAVAMRLEFSSSAHSGVR